jgi:hypothetical protein
MSRIGVAVVIVLAACSSKHERAKEAPRPSAADRAKAQAEEDARRDRVTEAVANPLALTDAPCPHVPMAPPAALGDLSLAFSDDLPGKPGDQTSGYLMLYLRLIGSDVEIVAAPRAQAPLDPRTGFESPHVTLVIDRWSDPVLPASGEGQFASGEVTGRVYVWDAAAKAFTCGAAVTAHNTGVTVVRTDTGAAAQDSQEDPLSKARVDLVNEALRAGLGALHATR